MSLPFSLLAIVGTSGRAARLLEDLRAHPGLRLGLMLRDPGHDPDSVAALVRAVTDEAAVAAGVTLIANGTVIPGIGGAHWPSTFLADGAPLGRPRGGLAGASTHSLDEALRAEAAGADYVTFGPVFPTGSKPGHPGTGLDLLARICRAASIPVLALGGITPEVIPACLDAGAHGVASISLFDDPDWMNLDITHPHDR